mmetsp:Transcript_52198/g.151968  ORF Transcript_52198/g.151968 Transcript_52198/m.151968 type:complete len:401 (-) Transcript_52198:63-1265(-)
MKRWLGALPLAAMILSWPATTVAVAVAAHGFVERFHVEGKFAQEGARQLPTDAPQWTSMEPDSTDYNPETLVAGWPLTVEATAAMLYCFMLASTPLLLAALADRKLTRAHMLESVALIAWLGSVLFLFTNILKFQSSHWTGYRPLTLVEAVYLMSQIVTTVGYGDITPAFPRGQVWVAFNVILGLCLYGSIVMEVVEIVLERVRKAMARGSSGRQEGMPLKDWNAELQVNLAPLAESATSFALLATAGVLFWHLYPGEDKTWLQAMYMSVITLSTVGFGAFNATTEAGKVFGAFWMLFGVASLGALISSFIETMLHLKHAEARRRADLGAEFAKIVNQVSSTDGTIDKAQFLKFGLMLAQNTDPNVFVKIDKRFQYLAGEGNDKGMVRRTTLVEAEGPNL